MNNFEKEPSGVSDGVLNEIIESTPKPTDEDIAKRPNPEDIADLSGENILGKRDRDVIGIEDRESSQ